jgi:heavy metal sensor kinase
VTLATRLSLFFLTMLALVLASFSVGLYVLARGHLYAQTDERLDAALNVLMAAAEVSPQGVEWEPAERHLRFGEIGSGGQLFWQVVGPEGQVLDASVPPPPGDFLREAAGSRHARHGPPDRLGWRGGQWLFRQQRLEATSQTAQSQQVATGPNDHKYPEMFILVGTTLVPLWATLRTLAWTVVGLSVAIWLAALLVGRGLCRRALLPVTRMAAAARGMGAADLDQRLPAVTARDELEDLSRAFNGLLDRVQESFERQRRFTGEASHQLRTPLTAMLGQVEVALRRERPAEDYQRSLAAVKQQAERMRRIVESLLFLARADAEARLPDRERVDLRKWLADYLLAQQDHPRAGDLRVDTAGIDQAFVQVHPVLLGELLNILLDNAWKYSPSGTPVVLQVRQDGESVELSVHDQGPGISPQDLPHLFTPFFRSAEARRLGVEGLGLGLAIARRLTTALGGSLTVISELGRGSCFTLDLPAAR